jgi:hypothetical protein
MKKVLFVFVLMMAVVVVNAQTAKTPETKSKSTHTTVQVADLQKTIKDNIAKDYAGFTVKSATSVTESNVLTYHVVVAKGSSTETLIYDKDGKFLKKHSDMTAHHSKSKKHS